MLIRLFSFSKKFYPPILLLSLFFVWSSRIWSGEMVYSNQQLYDVRSGFPIAYISSDFVGNSSNATGLYKLPQKMNTYIYPGQSLNTVLWPQIFLSVIIVQVVFMGILFLVYLYIPRAYYFFKFFSVMNVLAGLFLLIVVVIINIFGPSLMVGRRIPIQSSRLISLSTENTYDTFGEVLEKESAKEVFATAFFNQRISLEEAKSAVNNIPFTVKGIRFNTGESNGGCGVKDGQTAIQALDSCAKEQSLFLKRRIELEKNSLLTVKDPGLQKAFVAHIAEAENEQKIQITALELYGKAADLQRFKEYNEFVEKIEIRNQGIQSSSITSQSGMQNPVMLPPPPLVRPLLSPVPAN